MALESTATLGVLDDAGIITYSYETQMYGRFNVYQTFQLDSLADLLIISHALRIDTLWMTPGARLSQNARRMMEDVAPALEIIGSKKRDGTPRFLLVWKRQGVNEFKEIEPRMSVKLAWPEHDSRWPWQHCTDASTLLKSLLYLQDALEMEISWSPGHVGQQMMIQHNEKHADWLAPADIPDTVRLNLAVDMQWKRELTGSENGPGMYLHLFDKNAQYLGACTSALLGEGNPFHVSPVEAEVIFQPRMPGLWRIGDKWYWTPELEYHFAGLDIRPLITEAYIWPKAHTALRSWGEHMWDARCNLKAGCTLGGATYQHEEARQMAYKAIKSIYTQGMGWLAMESKRGDNKLYRPDWWSMIVSTAVRSMQFKIKQLGKHGLYPCYVNVDTLGIITQGESLEPVQTCVLNRVGLLGGFKHVASIPVTPDLAALFEEDVSFRDCQNGVLAAQEEGVRV